MQRQSSAVNINLNTILVIATGVVGVIYIIAITSVLIWYQGDVVVAGVLLTAGAGTAFTSLQGYRQSVNNAAMLDQVVAKTDQVTAMVDDNTATTDATHRAVNSRMDEFMDRVQQLANVQEQLSNALALAHGITVGRAQMSAESNAEPPEGGPDATDRT